MPVEHTHFIDFAQNAISTGHAVEFDCRNAISRAYYAAYHKACTKLEELNIPIQRVPNAGSHQALIETIRRAGTTGRLIADDLNRLKTHRHLSDYKLNQTVGFKVANKCVAQSVHVIAMLDELQP